MTKSKPTDPDCPTGNTSQCSKTYKTKPTLAEITSDPYVDAELKKAWSESNPNAPDVHKNDKTKKSKKKEQGGGVYWNKKTGKLKIVRTPPGDRDGTSGAPASIGGDYEKVAEFHTHPNKKSEGYSADPSPADRNYVKNTSKVPEIIETHEGRKTIPYP